MELLTIEECKAIIKKLSKALCVRPVLITQRLLSKEDKQDMKQGDLPIESLKCHIITWLNNGMPDYVHVKTETQAGAQYISGKENPMEEGCLLRHNESLMFKYRPPFVNRNT